MTDDFIDWVPINRVVDEALNKVLDFMDTMNWDWNTYPTRSYLNFRLEKARVRLEVRKQMEANSG